MAGPSGPRDGGAEGAGREPDPPEGGTPRDGAGGFDDDDVATRWAEITERLGPIDGSGPRDYAVDDEEGFVPPDPPPLGAADPTVVLGWVAVAAGVAAFLVLALAWDGAPGPMLMLALVLVGAGAGILLWRLPGQHDDDSPGGGAVV